MSEQTPEYIANAIAGKDQRNIDAAADKLLDHTLGKYLHEVISAGKEPSREGLRAWAVARAVDAGPTASWFEAVVRLVDGSATSATK